MLHTSAKGLHELLGAVPAKAGEVHDDGRLVCRDAWGKTAGGLFGDAIEQTMLHLAPRGMRLVWLPQAATDAQHLASSLDELRRQIGSDVASATDDDNAHSICILSQRKTAGTGLGSRGH
jgi:hypothetical protein